MMRETSPRLGRGLAALLGEGTSLQSTLPGSTLQAIPLSSIRTSPHQPRRIFDERSLAELTESIAQQGVIQPILVRRLDEEPPCYELVAGERRWRAAAKAGLQEIPCIVRALTDSASALAALVENLQRDDLNALDEAEGFSHAIAAFGLTQEDLAKAVGKSRSHVANTIRLLNLPEPVRDHLRAGRLTAGHARALLTHMNPVQVAEQVIASGLNVRQTEDLTSERPGSAEPGEPERDADVASLERELTSRLGLAVSIAHRKGGGRLTIRYRTADQLEGIIALLNRG